MAFFVLVATTEISSTTTMPLISEPSIASPIGRVPYDILREIFTHCQPRCPLYHQQPNVTTAPILLCHICSSWRTVGLGSPTLWTRLNYGLTIAEDWDKESASCKYDLIERDIEFIQWWKKNQGTIPPFLNLDAYTRRGKDIKKKLVGDKMDFLLEYVTSAQYLELDMFYWSRIHDRINAGYQVVFPNLHIQRMDSFDADSYSFYQVQSLLPAHTMSALRRLSISQDMLPYDFVIPDHWTALTYIFLSSVSISLNFWFSLIRAIPNLRWGYFDISSLESINYTMPLPCTHSQLTTMSVAVRGEVARRIVFPLSLLFTDLHLPALRTLSLSAHGTKSWRDHRAITELYGVLKSTPAITTLALEENFLSLDNCDTVVLLATVESVAPVWKHTPQLVHLQLNLPHTFSLNEDVDEDEAETEENLDLFVRNILSANNKWLDLQNSASPIRSVSIIDFDSSNLWFERIRDLTMSTIRKYSKMAPNVVFQISPESLIEPISE